MAILKPGDKCIVLQSLAGDEGKIVIVDDYFNGGSYNEMEWDENCDVIIEAFGSPLHKIQDLTLRISVEDPRPYASKWLKKLPEIKEEVEEKEYAEIPC